VSTGQVEDETTVKAQNSQPEEPALRLENIAKTAKVVNPTRFRVATRSNDTGMKHSNRNKSRRRRGGKFIG
jgi:hypothetical protein